MIEQWIRWEPIPHLVRQYYIWKLTDFEGKLEIILKDAVNDTPSVKVVFNSIRCAYRYTDELFRAELVHKLNQQHAGTSYMNWTFFKVENSSYIKWFSEQSYTISDRFGLKHFAIITDDEMLDIATLHEPKVEFVQE